MGDVGMLNFNRYNSCFGFKNGNINLRSDYIWAAADDEISKFGALNIDPATAKQDDTRVLTDIPIEFALLSYYSPAVKNIRPNAAAAMLPADNPKLAGKIFGADLYKDIQVLRFLASTDVGRYEGMLKFVCDKNGVTRAEIEKFYRDGIRGLIAEMVNEEFNKISISLYAHNATLTRNPQNGHYTLSYGGVNTNNETRAITANSLEALSSEMQNGQRKSDFTAADLNAVSTQAALIPAVIYADWKKKGVAGGVDALALITDTLTNFYLNPTEQTYNAIAGIYARYRMARELSSDRVLATALIFLLENTLNSLTDGFGTRLSASKIDIRTASHIPNDRRFDIFSVRYGIDDK